MNLYCPPDIVEAYDAWGATCGPASLAALLGRPVMAVRELFPRYKGYCNLTHVTTALTLAGARFRTEHRPRLWPDCGLAFVQIDGPWCAKGVPPGAAYKHSHWCAARFRQHMSASRPEYWDVYDMNANGWLPLPRWEAEILPLLLAAHKRSTGYWLRAGIEVLSTPEENA